MQALLTARNFEVMFNGFNVDIIIQVKRESSQIKD